MPPACSPPRGFRSACQTAASSPRTAGAWHQGPAARQPTTGDTSVCGGDSRCGTRRPSCTVRTCRPPSFLRASVSKTPIPHARAAHPPTFASSCSVAATAFAWALRYRWANWGRGVAGRGRSPSVTALVDTPASRRRRAVTPPPGVASRAGALPRSGGSGRGSLSAPGSAALAAPRRSCSARIRSSRVAALCNGASPVSARAAATAAAAANAHSASSAAADGLRLRTIIAACRRCRPECDGSVAASAARAGRAGGGSGGGGGGGHQALKRPAGALQSRAFSGCPCAAGRPLSAAGLPGTPNGTRT